MLCELYICTFIKIKILTKFLRKNLKISRNVIHKYTRSINSKQSFTRTEENLVTHVLTGTINWDNI